VGGLALFWSEEKETVPPHLGTVLDVSPDGSLVIVGIWPDLLLRNLATGQVSSLRRSLNLSRAVFSPDSRRLVLVGPDRSHLVELGGTEPSESWDWERSLFVFSQGGATLFLADHFGDVSRMDLGTGRTVRLPGGDDVLLSLMDESSHLSGLVCSPDGKWLAVSCWGDYGGGFRVCHLPTGRWSPPLPPWTWEASEEEAGEHWHTDLGQMLAICSDSSTLAVIGEAGEVCLWDLAREREIARLLWEGKWPVNLAFSPDGQILAVGETTGVVLLLPWRRLLAGCPTVGKGDQEGQP
jgi:WD40 repeat protein